MPLGLRLLRYAISAGGSIVAVAIGVAAYTGHQLNGPRRSTFRDTMAFSPWELGVPYEKVCFHTEDGIAIRGWWLPRDDTERVVIACPGHRGAKQDLLGIACGLWRAGNNVLLFDFRGCGESDRAPLSLAHHETIDARGAVTFVHTRVPHARIGMIGYSMGGAVAILVAAEDSSIRVVVSDSAFSSVSDVLAHAYRRFGVPAHPILEIADVYNRYRYGYSLAAIRPIDAVARIAPRPLLLIHASGDDMVPVEHAYRLAEAAGMGSELWIVDTPQHCGSYFVDRQDYVARVACFFADALSPEPGGEE